MTRDYPSAYDHSQAHLFRIGLTPIPISDWFEGPFEKRDGPPEKRKSAVLATAPDHAWGEAPGSRPGQAEALGLMLDHIGKLPAPTQRPPLLAASLLVDDDLCLMEKRNNAWTLTAASLCAPSFFSADHVIGKSLEDLHIPVTGFRHSLLHRVTRIFDNLLADQIIERRNWSVVASGDLFLPEERVVRSDQSNISTADVAEKLFVRMERQTLRRLPKTGGILFTIRIWRHPLVALRDNPTRLNAFSKAWERIMQPEGQDFRDYKQLGPLDPLVRHFLAEPHVR